MSLRVWLPLTGTLENKGASGITVTNSGATVNASGKVGSCYYFNASSYLYENMYDWSNFNTSQFSLCCWYKEPSPVASGNSQIICIGTNSGWNNIRIGLLRRTSNGYPMFSVSNGSSYVGYNCTATNFPLDTWNHIACTYDNGIIKIYLNGNLDTTYTTTIVPALNSSQHLGVGAASNGAEKLTGYLNDVRIYDHCLSQAEVREIAQGLVLHYKLDDGNENMLSDIPKSLTPTAYCGYQLAMKENLKEGQTYTLQLWDVDIAHSAKAESATGIWIYWGGGSVTLGSWAGTSNFTNGHADYLTKTFTITSSQASGSGAANAWFNMYNSVGYVAGTMDMHIGAWKLEKGSVATPWTSGGSSNIIEDSSGYGRHLISNSALSINTDTPRYSHATLFDGTQVATGTTPDADIRTISCWVKTTKNKSTSQIFVGDSASNMCISFYSGCIIGVFGTTRSTGSKCTLDSSYKENDWNHIVVVKTSDDGQRNIWCNGVQLSPTTNDYWSATAGLWLGARNSSLGQPLYGALSDVRFYVTQLSDTDIKSLYNNGIKVDNKNKLHMFELQEKTSNLLGKVPLTTSYSTHSTDTGLLQPGATDIKMTAQASIGSDYLQVKSGDVLCYDLIYSVAAGNQFYIGIEKYDAARTARSNNACQYLVNTKPTADIAYQRTKGTVTLTTDGTNPIDAIALRVLNAWSGTTTDSTKEATIHYMNFYIKGSTSTLKFYKTGIVQANELTEYANTKIFNTGLIETNQFIEH